MTTLAETTLGSHSFLKTSQGGMCMEIAMKTWVGHDHPNNNNFSGVTIAPSWGQSPTGTLTSIKSLCIQGGHEGWKSVQSMRL